MNRFLSPLGFIQHAHGPSIIVDELKRLEQSGETITAELAEAAVTRAFRLGEITARRTAARARRIEEGAEKP